MYNQGICSNHAAGDSEDVFISWQGVLEWRRECEECEKFEE